MNQETPVQETAQGETEQQADLEMTAAQLKTVARTRALAEQAQKKPRRKRAEPVEMAPAEEPPRRRGRPRGARGARVERASAPVVALRRAIAEHEREIKRLNRALHSLGAA